MSIEKDTPSIAGDEEINDEIEIDLTPENGGAAEKINKLKQRCKAANIEIRIKEFEDGQKFRSIILSSGRDTRLVPASGERLDRLLEIKFEDFAFICGLEAICSYTNQTIEAGIRGVPSSFFLQRLLGQRPGEEAKEEKLLVTRPEDSQGPAIEISSCTEEFAILTGDSFGGRRISIKLFGGGFTNQEEAASLLEKFSNSVAFQFELSRGYGFSLMQQRTRRFIPRRKRDEKLEVQYPTHEYESAPISLYWYAKMARGLPLLKFLALYQCVEFFFPTYSEAEAKRRISLLLKDPTFRSDRDSDLARVVTAIRVGRSGLGDEKAQLRSVLDECIDPEELRKVIESDDRLSEYLSNSKSKSKFHKIPLKNRNADLRGDVAQRIYDIRCKIVHTKDESNRDGRGMILPFSAEADEIEIDNILLEFIAQKVLIASSVPLRIVN